jgi:hypothetical protein
VGSDAIKPDAFQPLLDIIKRVEAVQKPIN